METVRAIKIDGATWTIEDGGVLQPDRGRRYRVIKFSLGARVRYGQIATPKEFSELSQDVFELVFILGEDAPSRLAT